MAHSLALALLAAAAAGTALLLLQLGALRRHLAAPPAAPRGRPSISVLKPLCGVDDELEENLASFAMLAWPDYEVLLGLRGPDDAACPLARRFEAAFPGRFRVVFQRGEPGLNPKVNQLVTLAQDARFGLLLVSDSNTRLPAHALAEVVAHFEDLRVACVTHPVSGAGHRSFGAVLDNLHLAAGVGAAQLAVKTLVGQDLVVGKSMALRRSALDRLGGFVRYADVLAEDYVIGQDLRRAGFELRVARTPVMNVATRRSVGAFFERYLRHETRFPDAAALARQIRLDVARAERHFKVSR